MNIEGKVTIHKNDILIVEQDLNAIQPELKGYFSGLMRTPGTDKAIDNLFTAYGEVFGGTEDGKDGILISADGNEETMITTHMSDDPTKDYSRRWKGEWTNESGVTKQIAFFTLGHNFQGAADADPATLFEVPYSRYINNNFDAQDLDTVIIEWLIDIN